MKFLPGEQTVTSAGGVLLTNYRLRLEAEAAGFATLRSIMLDELAFCEVTRTSNPALLVVASLILIIGVVIGAIAQSFAPVGIALFLSLIFVAFYFTSHQQVMVFASSGGRIKIILSKLKYEQAKDFIEKVEETRNARVFSA